MVTDQTKNLLVLGSQMLDPVADLHTGRPQDDERRRHLPQPAHPRPPSRPGAPLTGGGEGDSSSTDSSAVIRPTSGTYDAAGLPAVSVGCAEVPWVSVVTLIQSVGYGAVLRKRDSSVRAGRAPGSKNCVARAGGTAVPCMRTSWQVKQNAASNSARSRESS
jgi:hypothetical protein